jgi:hypothetical protein
MTEGRQPYLDPDTPEARNAVERIFANSDVLVEVHFPRSGTSSDWYLFEDVEQLRQLLSKLAPGVEVYLTNVSDLDDRSVALQLMKARATS